MTEFTVKLSGLNPMTVKAAAVSLKDGFVIFTGTPDEIGNSAILFTVSSDKLEYFGLPDSFSITQKR